MRIYLRHSDKEYKNGDRGFDPPLTNKGRSKVIPLGIALLQRYGIPTTIICSPYLRCRETAELLHRAIFDKTKQRVGIRCDPSISEYLGNHPGQPFIVSDETRAYNPPQTETFYQMESRVHTHNDRMRDFDRDRRPVWIVTHGLIIDRLLAFMGFRRPPAIPPLCFVVFHQPAELPPRGWFRSNKRIKRLRR